MGLERLPVVLRPDDGRLVLVRDDIGKILVSNGAAWVRDPEVALKAIAEAAPLTDDEVRTPIAAGILSQSPSR